MSDTQMWGWCMNQGTGPAWATRSLILVIFLASSMAGQEDPLYHSVTGRVMAQDDLPTQLIRVILSKQEGSIIGKQTVGYDGFFIFESLLPGGYLLMVERAKFATITRPIEIKNYSERRTVFLDIRLKKNETASIREVVRDYDSVPSARREEKQSKKISRRAGKAFLKASKEATKGNRLRAIEYLKSAVEAYPNFFEAYYNLGVHYQALKQWGKAVQAYRQAIAVRQQSAKANFNLGDIFHNQGRFDQAIERYLQALESDPDFAEAHQAAGEAFFQKKHYYTAEQHLETATRLSPANMKLSFGLLVKIQLLKNDWTQAQYYVDQFLRSHANDPVALNLQKEIDKMSVEKKLGP